MSEGMTFPPPSALSAMEPCSVCVASVRRPCVPPAFHFPFAVCPAQEAAVTLGAGVPGSLMCPFALTIGELEFLVSSGVCSEH